MKIKEFIRSLPINQIIEVYDGSHNIAYHGKAGFAYPKLNYLDDEFISSTEEDFTDIDGKSGKRILINAAKRQDLPKDYQNIYDDVAQYIRREVEGAFEDLGSTKLTYNTISDEIKTYSAEWGSETETSEMARLREDAINATINAFLEGCFDALPKDISSSRQGNSTRRETLPVPTNASIQPGLVSKVLFDIDRQIHEHGGASAALVAAWEDIDGQVDLVAMLVQAAGGYDLYHTSDGFFNDEDYLIVKAGEDIDPVFANLEMKTPNDLEKI